MIGRADYEERKAALIERLRIRAKKRRNEEQSRLDTAHSIWSMIPFGQPILVDHYSANRHLRDIERIDTNMRKGIDAGRDADYAEAKAERLENEYTISSDDPNCIEKLKERLMQQKEAHAKMKAANSAIRAGKGREGLIALGFSEELASELLDNNRFGGLGYASFSLTNSNARIKATEKRIESIEKRSKSNDAFTDERHGDVTITIRNNRLMMIFPGKPDESTRSKLKRNGFRWSPTSGAWQRMPNQCAYLAAREIAKSLQGQSSCAT